MESVYDEGNGLFCMNKEPLIGPGNEKQKYLLLHSFLYFSLRVEDADKIAHLKKKTRKYVEKPT